MPRARALCGTYPAYRRHLRDGEPVDEACRAAQLRYAEAQKEKHDSESLGRPVAQLPEPSREASFVLDHRAELVENLQVVKASLRATAEADATKVAPLSKRVSELVAEIAAFDGGGAAEADPFDDFLSGSNVIGITTAPSRK